jgi:hypothetical protein
MQLPHQGVFEEAHQIEFKQSISNSMRDRCQPGLSDLYVILRGVKAGPDSADDLAIDHNGKSTLHLGEALRRNGGNATVVDRIFERLTWLLEQRRRSSLARSKFDAGEIGRMVHSLDQDRPPAVIDHRHNSSQVIASRF